MVSETSPRGRSYGLASPFPFLPHLTWTAALGGKGWVWTPSYFIYEKNWESGSWGVLFEITQLVNRVRIPAQVPDLETCMVTVSPSCLWQFVNSEISDIQKEFVELKLEGCIDVSRWRGREENSGQTEHHAQWLWSEEVESFQKPGSPVWPLQHRQERGKWVRPVRRHGVLGRQGAGLVKPS